MKNLTEEQVALAERYAAALETIERLRDMLPSDDDTKQIESYVKNLAYIVKHSDELCEQTSEMASQYAHDLSEIKRLGDDYLCEESAELASQYAHNLSEIERLADEWLNDEAAEQAATYAQDLRDIAQLA